MPIKYKTNIEKHWTTLKDLGGSSTDDFSVCFNISLFLPERAPLWAATLTRLGHTRDPCIHRARIHLGSGYTRVPGILG